MKKILGSLIVSLLILSGTSAYYNNSANNGFNDPIYGKIKFNAELKDGAVHTEWTMYNGEEKFKYYKIVRSQKVTNPVYPDDGYIKYNSNINNDEYIDYKAPTGTNYYRVCAITRENNRYCSNVVKVNIDARDNSKDVECTAEYAPVCGHKNGQKKTYSNKCNLKRSNAVYLSYGKCKTLSPVVGKPAINDGGLNYKLKVRADLLIRKFVNNLEKRDLSDSAKVSIINKLINKLEGLKNSKPKLKNIINYLIDRLEETLEKYENGFGDIEDLFGEY